MGASSDNDAGTAGRSRDPMGLPNGALLFSAGNGFCHRHNKKNMKTRIGQIGCDFGIYIQSNIPETDPSTRVVVVDSPEWHEIQPQPVMPYEDIYGIPQPFTDMMATTGDETCIIGAASLDGQIDPENGWQGPDNPKWCKHQGCSLQGVDKSSLVAAIKFWRPIAWNQVTKHSDFDGLHNHKLEVLGTVPLQRDDSFVAELPCDTPLLMASVDAEGRSLARDRLPMSLRPGEKRTCSGCHDHDNPNPKDFDISVAATVTPTMIPATGTLYEWNSDIWPMLDTNCRINMPFPWDSGEKAVYDYITTARALGVTIKPPQRRKYINSLFARESLLYWLAIGQRMDGRTDTDRNDDIDLGMPPPSACLNAAQLQTLADWIEAGAYRFNGTH